MTYQNIWIKISKKDDADFKSHESENFILSPAVAIIPNTQWQIAVMLFTNLAFMKLSSPLGNKLRGF